MENTHNKAGGVVVPLENMQEIYEVAREAGIPVHLDGARLFNASAATGISLKRYANQTDTVQVCLSKGLGAPVGSIIAGSYPFIQKARKMEKASGRWITSSWDDCCTCVHSLDGNGRPARGRSPPCQTIGSWPATDRRITGGKAGN
ncbi:L-allo-threonine aldolase [Halobacillus karajensis]|uniref:L-allo-threonine aldolase n=1 Tax=Halobacillus karajensis TaxID=195088 RepID=A0A059NZA9_9BACI|nr:L-allo-threonine aldolase [Halobacillus karajensis]CDQ23482.1 L-allo-threonine aldolase [Halobacillus karajensis]CDQ26964.1 L-allo-threonine aldolase [Halobacillus karajensis]